MPQKERERETDTECLLESLHNQVAPAPEQGQGGTHKCQGISKQAPDKHAKSALRLLAT